MGEGEDDGSVKPRKGKGGKGVGDSGELLHIHISAAASSSLIYK